MVSPEFPRCPRNFEGDPVLCSPVRGRCGAAEAALRGDLRQGSASGETVPKSSSWGMPTSDGDGSEALSLHEVAAQCLRRVDIDWPEHDNRVVAAAILWQMKKQSRPRIPIANVR